MLPIAAMFASVTTQPPPPQALPQAGGATILLVEDDRASAALFAGLLKAQGYQVEVAARRSEAKACFARAPKLIIVDGLLPDGMGHDVINDARAAGLDAPVIFLTAFFKDNRSSRSLVSQTKVAAILHKPVRPDALLTAVRQALAEQPGAQGAGP